MESKERGGSSPLKNVEDSSKDESEMLLPQSNDNSADQSNDDDSSSDDTSTKIPGDDLIVQILARLDGPSYSKAIHEDARTINENFLFPPHFPWHSSVSKRLPQKMTKTMPRDTMPRDIDGLHVITQCEDELHAPFGDFQGPFGFGRYENGQSRGNYSNVPGAAVLSRKPGSFISAAARRSHDPGVLELMVQSALPSSIDAIRMNTEDPHFSTPAEKWKSELLKDPDRADMLSHLPFHWGKRGGDPLTTVQQSSHAVDSSNLSRSIARREHSISLATSCSKKWKISMKAGGVSTRNTLFPSSTRINTDGGQVPENTRKVLRPMLTSASLPHSIQSGQTVPTEKALEMAHGLGSYDCKFTDALFSPKKDGVIRAKRIEVGRNRLVWSNIGGDCQPLPTSTRARVSFNSLITGQRVDASKCRRPTEVKVGVRLNGKIVMEEALEDFQATASNSVRKRKHSTRSAEYEGPALKSRVLCPESRTDKEIDSALRKNSVTLQMDPQEGSFSKQSAENGAVVYLDMGSQSSSDIDRNDIIATLLKFNHKKPAQKKIRRSASSEPISAEAAPMTSGGSHVIKQSNFPRFACVPLEDGLMRTICLNAGSMTGTAVHQAIRNVPHQEPGRRCSVCWSDEGSGKEGVHECVTCGLLAHTSCCHDKGKFSTIPRDPVDTKQDQVRSSNGAVKEEHSRDQAEKWQCAVCCSYTEMKPRRNSRMPSRFVDDEIYASSLHINGNEVANGNANLPGPRCSLCPHRGGAMSPLEFPGSKQWAHEVCRVWSGMDHSEDPEAKRCSLVFPQFPNGSPLSNVCALCGTGATKGSKSMQFNAGLTKCAARGCLVAFHPMCALLASKVGIDDKGGKTKSVRTRKTRQGGQAAEEKKSDDDENIEADKKLCNEYTLKLVQLTRTEKAIGSAADEDKVTTIPIAFCGIHNPRREDSFFGCLPGGTVI